MLLKSFLLLFPLVLLYCVREGAGSKSCWLQDREALVDLQKAATPTGPGRLFRGDVAFNKSATPWFEWDPEAADCCQWQGVSCDQHSGRVIELRLPTCEGLIKVDVSHVVRFPLPLQHCLYECSSLPSTLSQLEALQVLDLCGGCFTGDIPPHTFATLTNLTHLDLSNNFLLYPAQLPLLPKLTYFNFSSNYLHFLYYGRPGFNLSSLARSLPHLRYLDLGSSLSLNQTFVDIFRGSINIPNSELTAANFSPHLIHLDISGNMLSGTIPEQLGTLQSLQYLNLAGNRFRNPVPWPSLANLSQLRVLKLGNFIFSEEDILVWEERRTQWPCKWKALESLSCENMRFASDDSTPFCLEQPGIISKLRYLSFTLPIGSIAPLLRSLSSANTSLSLQSLLLPGTSLGDFQPPHLPAWLRPLHTPFLESLDVSYNALTSFPNWLTPYIPVLESLDISVNNLTEFPSTLRQSRFLKSLDISYNQYLNVSLHQLELHTSARLQRLTLSENAITGTIPRSLLMLSLSSLDLSYNQLEGGIPFAIGNLSLLTHLDLSWNKLTGAIPPSIGMSKALSFLDLSYNMLFGGIPQSMGNLTALTQLYLFNNLLSGEIPQSMANLTALKVLDLSNNMLFGEIPESMGNLTTLTQLYLSHNNLLGTIPASIFQLIQLSYLILPFNNLSGSLPPSLQGCAALQILDLSNNRLSGRLPSLFFETCPVLEYIALSNNGLSGTLPQTYQNCEHLDSLDLSSNKLTGEIPEAMFHNCQALSLVNLGQNFLSFELPTSVANLTQINGLILSKNELSGAIPSTLQNCSWLMVLDLSYNHLGGSLPHWISGTNCPALVVLMLSNNKLQGSIPSSLVSNFTRLQMIGLANNKLSGSIPLHFSHLVAMSPNLSLFIDTLNIPNKGIDQALSGYILSATVVLDLSGNYLEGPIPDQIGALKGLTLLNLSRNALSGPIPSTLGGLSASLESLDLSNNQLEGGIPSELCSLDGLGYLNLSSNHLQGPIPACRRLSNFDEYCFGHNPGLCGPPLLEQCTADEAQAEAAQGQEGSGHHRTWFEKLEEVVELGGVGIGYAVGFLVTGWVLNRRLLPP